MHREILLLVLLWNLCSNFQMSPTKIRIDWAHPTEYVSTFFQKLWFCLNYWRTDPFFHDKYKQAIAPRRTLECTWVLTLNTAALYTRDQNNPDYWKTKITVCGLISVAVAWTCRSETFSRLPSSTLAEGPEFEWSVPMVQKRDVHCSITSITGFCALCSPLFGPGIAPWLHVAAGCAFWAWSVVSAVSVSLCV